MAEVSILIPAYQAEAFIRRTLDFAAGQTFGDVAIIVSVDASSDNTLAIVADAAARDARMIVHRQEERLGWARNVNFLLDRVETPFHFIYFHDDIIVPQYVERLLAGLKAASDAASANCDMAHFGASNQITTGRAYPGDTVTRLLSLMLTPNRGAPLRSMMRRTLTKHLRLPEGKSGGVWVNEPFLLDLVASGPAVYVPGAHYLRWDQRSGGLTDGWKDLTLDQHVESCRQNLADSMSIVDRAGIAGADRPALLLACWLWSHRWIAALERSSGHILITAPEALHPALAELPTPAVFDCFGPEIAGWGRARFAQVSEHLASRARP